MMDTSVLCGTNLDRRSSKGWVKLSGQIADKRLLQDLRACSDQVESALELPPDISAHQELSPPTKIDDDDIHQPTGDLHFHCSQERRTIECLK
jgi:hypothetical protein